MELDLSLSNASELLRRYYQNGLLMRERVRETWATIRAYRYALTQKGADRLEWLINTDWEVEYVEHTE